MPSSGAYPEPVIRVDFPDLSFTGGCEVDLQRAVVRYTASGERGLAGGRTEDLGVGVVLEAPARGVARVLDIGSGQLRETTLELPLVIFGWIFTGPYRELLRWVARQGEESTGRSERLPVAGNGLPGEDDPLSSGVLPPGVLRDLLSRLGFGPATRPVFLRAAFRDLALDLDPHEGTAVRLSLSGGGVCRVHLDYDRGVLVCRTGRSTPDRALAAALPDAFPNRTLYRVTSGAGQGTAEFHVHLPDLLSVAEVRNELRRIRRGLLHLLARFDPPRYRAVSDALAGFGERDLLAGVEEAGGSHPQGRRERIRVPRSAHRSGRVH